MDQQKYKDDESDEEYIGEFRVYPERGLKRPKPGAALDVTNCITDLSKIGMMDPLRPNKSVKSGIKKVLRMDFKKKIYSKHFLGGK